MNNNFCHLHIHQEYSCLDGYGSSCQYITRAKEMGFKSLAITDHGTISGTLKFQKEAKKQGINPIIGCELYIVPSAIKRVKEKAGHIIILCQNLTGWTELCRLLTYANLEGFYQRPRIDYGTLLNADTSGWIIMTGCANSFLKLKGGIDVLEDLYDKMADRLYIEIMPHQETIQKEYHEFLKPIWKDFKLPLVATNDCHYIIRGDWKSQEALLAIKINAKWDDPNRWKFNIKGLHLRSAQEMIKAFERQGQFSSSEIQEAMENTTKIAKQCGNFRIPKQEISLPEVPGLKGKDADEILYALCDGVGSSLPEWEDEHYIDRFLEEFNLIKKKGFAKYFLIVKDIINYCDKEGIEYGPGRGSVGGSLMAYLLGITKIDPIKFELSFARFISEERIDYPDIDIDFEDGKRDLVVKYIEDTYGKNNVCGISTDARMRSKNVLWDISRVFDIPHKDVSEITQAVVRPQDHEAAVQACFEDDGKWFAKKYPEASRLAIKLENQLRHHGQHPAAVVISADDLTDGKRTALKLQKGQVVSAWDMEDAEYVGLMKLDILGLSTLSVLAECKRLIKDEKFNFDDISLDDQEVFKQLSEGKTSGVFQFSAKPTTELCKEMGIESFNDMVAAVALVRPGPYQSGMTENYIKRKHGAKWEPKHEIYEEITRETFGIIVYQEQVMQVISKVAGLSESTADQIRKVIGKKRDVKEFEPYRKQFLKGCQEQKTLSVKEANEFWEGLKEHAHYSFNRAHSVGYSLIGYWTAFCKIHYPAEFLCSCLTYSKKDEKQDLINEAQQIGLKIMLPKVDISDATRWLISDRLLYAPFIEVNTMGPTQAEKYCKTKVEENVGFFNIKAVPDTKTQMGKLLTEIGAYEPEREPDNDIVEKHFSFSLSDGAYSGLSKALGFSFPKGEIPKWKTLDVPKDVVPYNLIKPVRRFQNEDLLDCDKCELRKECDAPVLPSPGVFNVVIVGEAPGPQENEHGRGFYEKAPAGKLLWKELDLYGLSRRMFHITNCLKCWPGEKALTAKHIEICKPWLDEEIAKLQPRLILAIGNTCVKMFTGRDGGIKKLSGTTEWNENIKAWLCWCLHPAAVKRNAGNQEYFEDGIRNFAAKFALLKPLRVLGKGMGDDIPF